MNMGLLFMSILSVLLNHSNEKYTPKRNHALTVICVTRRIYPKGWTREKRVFVTVFMPV